ncbi:hypothetical protein [Pelagovum pacificum]|nr:hypothetical protein [Pelagovum pacificum]QQA43072.1 hypothetical protein I8N54_00395 [Pelagovum pacificum]
MTDCFAVEQLFLPFCEVGTTDYFSRGPDSPFYRYMPPDEAVWRFDAMGLDFYKYHRITCVRDPFPRLAALFDRIHAARPLTGLRRHDRAERFQRWLATTRPDGPGAGGRPDQLWRRYGAWSAENWCGGKITHVIRRERLDTDLAEVCADIGFAPGGVPVVPPDDPDDWLGHYGPEAIAHVRSHYAWDLDVLGYGTADSCVA